MLNTERVLRAIKGQTVDRPPMTFWGHNFAKENSAEDLARESVDRFRRFDWDFIKIQSRASTFAEDWGNRLQFSEAPAVPPVLLDWPIRKVDDLKRIRPLDPLRGTLGEQIDALRMVRQEVGGSVPIVLTIFSPAMSISYLFGELFYEGTKLLSCLRNNPKEVHSALEAVMRTLIDYAQACLENGADGIFFAIKGASANQMTRDEYQEFGLPYDRPILDAAKAGWLNILHLCGSRLYFDVVSDLPTAAVNWAQDDGNPTLLDGLRMAGRTVVGGVSPQPKIRDMKPEEVAAEVTSALEETGGERLIIGPGCSISPDTPDANLHAARRALDAWMG